MDQILEILGKVGFDPRMALFNIINFIIVFLLLKKFLLGKLSTTLTLRQEQIRDSINSFQKAETELAMAKVNADEVIKEAKVQKDEIIENAHQEAKQLSSKLKEESESEIKNLISNAEKKIELDRTNMKKELKEETVNLVVEATEKILKTKLDKQTDTAVVSDLLNTIN